MCPGYRDQLSLLFRDESEKVVRKAKVPRSTPEHRKAAHCQTTSTNSTDSSVSTSPTRSVTPPNTVSQALGVSKSLTPQCLDEGVIFFFDHYVTVNSNCPSWKVDLPNSAIWPTLFGNRAFNNAVSSVGYAGLSNVTKNPEYTIIARRKYATSLQGITLALKDTSNADLDATFKSVILLAAFEVSFKESLAPCC